MLSDPNYADAAPAETPTNEEPEASTDEEGGDEQTAEIPKAVLGGKEFKPGEEVMLEVVQVMENSVLVKYASEKGEETEEAPAEGEAQNPGGEYNICSMMG